MKKYIFFLFLTLKCYSQDTIFLKIEPNKPIIVESARIEGDWVYIKNPNKESETKIELSRIYRIASKSELSNFNISYSDSLRTEEYCMIVGTAQLFSTKVKITIDFGEERDLWSGNNYFRDETGKAKKFNSMIDALNYMNSLGWEFIAAYPMFSSMGTAYHFMMKRKLKK